MFGCAFDCDFSVVCSLCLLLSWVGVRVFGFVLMVLLLYLCLV